MADKLLRYEGKMGSDYVLKFYLFHGCFIFSLLSQAVLSIFKSFVRVQMKQVFMREVTELNT